MNRLISGLAVILTCGAIWLAARHQPFERVDAGGHLVRILRSGRSGPTVVFESGAGSPLETWVRVQPEVSRFASTISYDRAGNGLSPRGPEPRTGRQIALELHTALHNAQVSPPYVLVGHSLGGPYLRVFADLYPKEVAGMVLVDPTQEDLVAWAKARDPQPPTHPPRPYDEVDCAPATFEQARDSFVPPGIPVVLLCGVGPRVIPAFINKELRDELKKDAQIFWPAKLKFHQAWIDKIPTGRLIATENSGHGIPFEEPDLVIRAIRQVVEVKR